MSERPLDTSPLAQVSIEDGSTLVFVRQLRQPPDVVWAALTEPAQLSAWAPFDSERSLATTGAATLTMVDGDTRTPLPAQVRVARAPHLLEYTWGDDLLRWELAPVAGGTRLTLRHTVRDATLLAQLAAGWHLCVAVAQHLLDGDPVGPIRGRDALRHGFVDLRGAYARQLGLS